MGKRPPKSAAGKDKRTADGPGGDKGGGSEEAGGRAAAVGRGGATPLGVRGGRVSRGHAGASRGVASPGGSRSIPSALAGLVKEETRGGASIWLLSAEALKILTPDQLNVLGLSARPPSPFTNPQRETYLTPAPLCTD